ncbi:MAG: Fic family protein [Petrimonas sp.]|nr:Fic family protein [Petrimonas sp.]
MIELPPKFEIDKLLENNLQLYFEISSELLISINNEYLYWDRVKYKSKNHRPEELWNAVKFSRFVKQTPFLFNKYLFKYVFTEYIQQMLHFLDMNIGGTLTSNVGIAESDKEKFLVSSIMEEAIASSQMEGAVTTRKKAKEMLQKELRPKSISEQMILNNYNTIKYIAQSKSEKLSSEELLYIHSLITKDTLDKKDEEGAYRTNDNIYVVNHSTSEVVHNPPSYIELPQLINALCTFFNTESQNFIHPIIKGIIIHFMVAWIHPFSDGNGRTARALFYWYLLKNGYWLTEYLSISRIIKDTKSQYEKSFLYTENDENDLSYFITYNLKTMKKAYDALKEYINHKQKEVNQAAKFLRISNVNERQAQILKLIYDDSDRVLSVKEMENRFLISGYTARTDLKGLVNLGLLKAINVNKKKQNFIKSANFEKIISSYK